MVDTYSKQCIHVRPQSNLMPAGVVGKPTSKRHRCRHHYFLWMVDRRSSSVVHIYINNILRQLLILDLFFSHVVLICYTARFNF